MPIWLGPHGLLGGYEVAAIDMQCAAQALARGILHGVNRVVAHHEHFALANHAPVPRGLDGPARASEELVRLAAVRHSDQRPHQMIVWNRTPGVFRALRHHYMQDREVIGTMQDLDVCLKREFFEESPIANSPLDNLLR